MHGGHRFGAGRPQGSKSQKTLEQEALRQYIFDEVKRNQQKIVGSLIRQAVKGQVQATKELLERTLGKVKNEHEIEANGTFSLTELAKDAAGRLKEKNQ